MSRVSEWSAYVDAVDRILRPGRLARSSGMKEPIWRRVLRLHGPDPRADIRDEFAFHLEERIEALMAQGMSETSAREEALRRFGDLSRATADLLPTSATGGCAGSAGANGSNRSGRTWSTP